MEKVENQFDHYAEFTMYKKEIDEFLKVNYNHYLQVAPFFFLLLIIYPDPFTLRLIALIFIVYFFLLIKQNKDAYNRVAFSHGKASITYKIGFAEQIILSDDITSPVSYDYAHINQILETDSFYLLKMKYKVYLIVDKRSLSNCNAFIDYLFQKCTHMKRKKIKNISNADRNYIILMIVTGVLALISPLAYLLW